MLTHTRSSSFIFKGKNINEGRRGFTVLCKKVALISPASMSKMPIYSHNTLTNTHFSVIQTRATFSPMHLIQSALYFNFLNRTKYFARVLTSKNPVLCLPEKIGQNDFFFTTQTTSIASHTKQEHWNGCVSVGKVFTVLYWELLSLLILHSANFPYGSYGPGLGRSPDAA